MAGPPATTETSSATTATAPRKRITFVMEQTLGHVSFAQNVRRSLLRDTSVEIAWLEISTAFERPWERLPLIRRNWSLRAGLKARGAIESQRRRSGRPHVYLFHTQVVSLLSAGWFPNRPRIVISLDATPLNYDRVGKAYGHRIDLAPAEKLKFWLNRRAFHHASFLVTWSAWARQSLIDDYGVPADLIEVIPPGTDLTLWQQEPPNPAEVPTEHSKVRLLFVGGDFLRKGGHLLYNAFAKNFADTCELHLVTKSREVPAGAGVSIYRDLPPNSAEIRSLFHAADVFVLPTQGDVHSIASIEAMAAGLPVVAADIGAISEVVSHGDTGLLVPPGDEKALTCALAKLIGDEGLRRAMGERARARAALKFDAQKNGRRLLSVCESLCDSAAPDAELNR